MGMVCAFSEVVVLLAPAGASQTLRRLLCHIYWTDERFVGSDGSA